MRRYLRLYAHFLRFSFSKAMEFRVDFFFRVVMDIIFYAVQFAFFHIIYLHTPILAGWDLDQMRVFIAGYIFIDALHMTVFASNCWWFPIYINRGDLDYYLTKPVSTLFFLSLKDFAANSFLNLVIAAGLLTWALSNYPGELSPLKTAIFIGLLFNGTFLYFLVNLLFLLAVFWTQSPRGFGDLFFSVSHVMERPDRIYRGVVRKAFIFVLPFALMASFPAKFLLEENQWSLLGTIFGVTAAFFIAIQIIWRLGLRSYSSASS
ncbi:MAG: ABC-2 family transporter protein [Bacteriovoracaceae bacterium]